MVKKRSPSIIYRYVKFFFYDCDNTRLYRYHTRKFPDCTIAQASNVANAMAKSYGWIITGFISVEY